MLPALLGQMDLTGMVVTADALHVVRSHAEYLHGRGAHYVLTVKSNQRRCTPNSRGCRGADPGRLAEQEPWTRTTGNPNPERPQWPTRLAPAARACCSRRHGRPSGSPRTRIVRSHGKVKRSSETAYAITSLTAMHATGEQLARCGTRPLGIENRLHHVRDVTWDEDRGQIRTGNGGQVMASLRSLAISILRLTEPPTSPLGYATTPTTPSDRSTPDRVVCGGSAPQTRPAFGGRVPAKS